ncbi:MAG: hypothetical protein WB760_12625 [Xanthobacteraceae bacterium]
MSDGDPHDEIERLEALIDKLDGRIAGCRKFVLAGQVAAAAGAILLFVTLFGVIRFDPRLMIGGMAALLGGFAVWGSNYSTLKEAQQELAESDVDRAALIGKIHLRVVGDRETLH